MDNEAQKTEVLSILHKSGCFNDACVDNMVEWFFTKLGLPMKYYRHTSSADIAKLIQSLQVYFEYFSLLFN
jgi:hypothetical protein